MPKSKKKTGKAVAKPEVGKTEVTPARTLADYELAPRELTEEEEELFDTFATLSPNAPTYLRALVKYGNSYFATAEIGIGPSVPRQWKARSPEFATIFATIKIEIAERWNAVAHNKALGGFEDRMYDKDDNLVGRRVRQDPTFLRAMLGSKDPENWGKEGASGLNITVVIVDAHE